MPRAPETYHPDGKTQAERERERKRVFDQFRGSSSARGYGHKWRIARAGYLRKHPTCVMCEELGIVMPATRVDHKTPHRGDTRLFWDRNNWQPLCEPHHNSKTAREDSNFTPAR